MMSSTNSHCNYMYLHFNIDGKIFIYSVSTRKHFCVNINFKWTIFIWKIFVKLSKWHAKDRKVILFVRGILCWFKPYLFHTIYIYPLLISHKGNIAFNIYNVDIKIAYHCSWGNSYRHAIITCWNIKCL